MPDWQTIDFALESTTQRELYTTQCNFSLRCVQGSCGFGVRPVTVSSHGQHKFGSFSASSENYAPGQNIPGLLGSAPYIAELGQ